LSPEDAAGHIGEIATVYGVMVSAEHEANVQNQPTLLDLGKPHPNAIFTAVIYGDNRQKFGTPGDLTPRQTHLRDGADQRLLEEAGDRPHRSEPVDGVDAWPLGSRGVLLRTSNEVVVWSTGDWQAPCKPSPPEGNRQSHRERVSFPRLEPEVRAC